MRSDQPPIFNWWERLQIWLIGFLGWLLIWLIGSTLRFRSEGAESLDRFREENQPVILSFWHNQIFAATYFFRFQNIVVMTSRHFDGEYIGKIIERFGYAAARGSSSRGAVRALLELKKRLAAGRDVAFTVDGPKGPVYVVKEGPVFLSRKSGAPILPFHLEVRDYWKVNSWDGFRIPKPFSEALIKFGRPLKPSEEPEDGAIRSYQAEMDRIRRHCEQFFRPEPAP